MRKLILPAAALAVLSSPAAAQDAPDAAPEAAPEAMPLADMAEQMRDPERQRDMALMLQAMTEVLLDMPIAPLAEAVAEMAGEQAEKVDPDLTLRKLAPDAGRVSDGVAVVVPRAMQAMGAMAEGAEEMKPALRSMMARMRDIMERAD